MLFFSIDGLEKYVVRPNYSEVKYYFQRVSPTTTAIKFRSGKQISPVIFYGSARGVPVKRPSRILRLLQEIRVDLREDNALICRYARLSCSKLLDQPIALPALFTSAPHSFHSNFRDGVWATFPRQEEAVRFSRAHRNSHVFSYQDHLTGKRRFLVSTYDEFWRRLNLIFYLLSLYLSFLFWICLGSLTEVELSALKCYFRPNW